MCRARLITRLCLHHYHVKGQGELVQLYPSPAPLLFPSSPHPEELAHLSLATPFPAEACQPFPKEPIFTPELFWSPHYASALPPPWGCLPLPPGAFPSPPTALTAEACPFRLPPMEEQGFLGGSSAGGAFLHGFLGIFSWYPGFCCLQPASGGRRRRQGKVLLAHQWENAGQEGVLWVGAPQKSHSFVVCPNRRVMSCFLYCRTSTCFPGPFLCSGAIITIKPLTWLVHTRVDSGLCLRPAFAVPKYM